VLGAGVGAEVGLLWGARKIAELERHDGRRVLRTLDLPQSDNNGEYRAVLGVIRH